MKEACRICARDLCGNQRRWIFHPAGQRKLQVLLSHAVGHDLQRDGRREFACGKCSFMLDRMFRFDTVIARVEALSLERLHTLLQEKERLRQCVSALYHKHNPQEASGSGDGLHRVQYSALLRDDLAYSLYESWAEDEDQLWECGRDPPCPPSESCWSWQRPPRCRGCRALRVPDADYEAVCKVPRKLARSVSCGPSTRSSASACGEVRTSPTLVPERCRTASSSSDGDRTLRERRSSAGSLDSLDVPGMEEEAPRLALYTPVRRPRGSRIPVLLNPAVLTGAALDRPDQWIRFEVEDHVMVRPDPALELEQLWPSLQDEFLPLGFRSVPQSLMEEHRSQRHQYEHAAGQCVSDLHSAQQQIQCLQTQIQTSDTSNRKLQEKVCEMESELLSIRRTAQNQQRNIQNLTDSLSTKDTETQELYHVIEDQNNTLCKLTETHQQQLQHTQAPEGSLFSCQLELEAVQRNHRLTQRRLEDLTRSRDRLQSDLQEVLEHRDTTHKHNQELREMLEQLRSELQVKVCELRDREAATRSEISGRDDTIAQLRQSLLRKHTLLQEYSELLNVSSDSSGASERDTLLHTLRSRIRDRDGALERAIDDKFRCLEEKDGEVRRLQLVLREKDRDLERLRCVLNNTNDTVTGLDALVRSKELELERTLGTCRKLEWMKQQSDEKNTLAVRERDGVIQRLQTALRTHSQETEELRSVLLGKVSAADVLQELQANLSVKECLFQEVMSDRSRQLQEHHTHLNELLDAISTRDQDMKEYGERLGRVISERSGQLQELRRQLSSREQELHDVNRERERDVSAARERQRLQNLLKEKDSFIQEILQDQSETLSSTAAAQGDLEIQAIRDELQIALRKQRETEHELSEMRSLLAAGHHDTLSFNQKCVLQQLVSEQQALNEALRAEKSLYQTLRSIQTQAESSAERTRALHVQLDSLQALREQLELTLARSRETALAVDRAALVQADYGGGTRMSLASGPAGGADASRA